MFIDCYRLAQQPSNRCHAHYLSDHLPFLGSPGDEICHFHIPHNVLYLPPQFCISIAFNFSWDSCNTQGEMENNGYAKFWGANKVHYGNCGSGIIGKTFVTHSLLNTKNIPCCMYTWIAQLPIIVFTCHYVYARSLGRGFTEHKVHRQTEVLLLSSLVRRLLALHNAWSILNFNWEQEQTFELSKEKGYLWMGHWRERREYRFPVNVQSIKMKCVYNYCVQRYEIYALIQSICNRSLPINTNLSIDCYWNSIPVNITTSIFAIDGSSIISSNRLIDIDRYWLISIVIDYPFIYWIPPGKLWQVFFWAAWFK